VGLGASGWANAFYSAAAQAGSQSWTALFFGSSDAAGSITVDKTPLAVWVMGLSVRMFGLSSWSLLVPEALMGVASLALLTRAGRRWFTPAAGLIAGAVLATTPVAALMFRFNNPDALLVLVLIASAWATMRALEAAVVRAGTRWLMLAGTFVGLGFMAKMLQAPLVLPALVLVYLCTAPVPLRRRLFQLVAAFGAMLVSAGWWMAAVMLVPASQRPWIGGSQTNSVLEPALGYNGLGRLTGDETGSVSGGNGWGVTGLTQLFDGEIGGQISWLAPASLLFLIAGLWLTRRAPRTDRTRAAFAIWGSWLLVTGLTFSLMAGIFHAYYTVALAPAVAALVGMGVAVGWQLRHKAIGSWLLAAAVALTGVWSWQLLGRSADFVPVLRWIVLIGSIAVADCLLLIDRMSRRTALALGGAGLVLSLAGPTAYGIRLPRRPTPGRSRPPDRRWPATSWPAAGRSCRSVGSTARTPRPPWPSSRPTWPPNRSTTSSAAVAASRPTPGRARRRRSRRGRRPPSPRPPSAARPDDLTTG
jgi:4-amino-4-deoxy-L-arabinose transferase-like glycosyltransferase